MWRGLGTGAGAGTTSGGHGGANAEADGRTDASWMSPTKMSVTRVISLIDGRKTRRLLRLDGVLVPVSLVRRWLIASWCGVLIVLISIMALDTLRTTRTTSSRYEY